MKKGLYEFLCVVLPKGVGGVGTIVLNLILLHVLGGEQTGPYGVYSLCVAGILMADGVFGTAFDMGVLRLAPLYRSVHPARSYSIERHALALKAGLVVTASLVVSLLAGPLSRLLFQAPGYEHLLHISCCAATALLLLRSTLLHLQIDRRFTLYGLVDLLHHVLKFGGIGAMLAFADATPANVLAWFAAAPSVAFVLFIGVLGRRLLFERSGERGVARELLGFVRWFLLTFCVTTLVSKLDILLLPILTGDLDEVGIFGGALVLTLIPELLGVYASVVLTPRIMPAFRDGRFPAFFQKYQAVATSVGVALFMAVWASMGFLKAHVLPESFERSALLILILMPGALGAMTSFPVAIPFLMFVRPRFFLALECVLLAPTLVLYYFAIRHYGALGAAWVTTGSRTLKALIAQYMAWHWAHLDPGSAGVAEGAYADPGKEIVG